MSSKIKKGDNVIVLAGKDKGKTGEVLNVLPAKQRVLVRAVSYTHLTLPTTLVV